MHDETPIDPPLPAPPRPATHLVAGILTMLFCCLPVGVVSIVYAAKVDAHWRHGDRGQALHNSRRAAQWALAAVGAWLLFLMLVFVLDLASP